MHPEDNYSLSVPLEGTREVWVCGRLVWQDGMEIRESTLALYGKKTPYVGNASAVGAALNEIDHWYGAMGPCTFSLETAARPSIKDYAASPAALEQLTALLA